MDTTIRARLLELPHLYAEAGSRLVEKIHQLTETKLLAEAFKAKVGADLAAKWREASSNKEIRDRELADRLATHDDYQRALGNMQAIEWSLSADRQLLESLRFEQQVLVAVLAADGTETRSLVRAGSTGTMWAPSTLIGQKEG